MQDNQVSAAASNLGCLVRLGWMVFGNLVLVLCVFGITQRSWHAFDYIDVAYFATVAAMIGLRFVDIRHYAGTTSTGEPATMADWRDYTWRVIGLAVGAWCLARGYAWFGAPPAAA